MINFSSEVGVEPTQIFANRLLEPFSREAQRLVLEGATPAQVDLVCCDLGLAMGILALHDLAGLDGGYSVREARREAIAHDPSYCRIADELQALGRCGHKSGRGFYLYEGHERKDDYEVIALAELLAGELQIRRRPISRQEIHDRCLLVLINEGLQMLDDGGAWRADDIDQLWREVCGSSTRLGGPMHLADSRGLGWVLGGILQYRDELGEYGRMWFRPALLLERLVASGNTGIEKI
ncbi:MAG: 3-hydroxyacyl-CoA dehydrogenase family protein [Pseudomonas sp.]